MKYQITVIDDSPDSPFAHGATDSRPITIQRRTAVDFEVQGRLKSQIKGDAMKISIQVVDGKTSSVLLQHEISVPDEIPYAPEEIQGGPMTLWGLKTALDYWLSRLPESADEPRI